MPTRRREPRWVSRLVVDAVHTEQLREHGGLPGVRDENVLESALARPQQRWHYEPEADLATVAAAYAFGFTRNHPYRDGNKRIGFVVMVTFLGVNGLEFEVADSEVVAEMLLLAEGALSEEQLAVWVRAHSTHVVAE